MIKIKLYNTSNVNSNNNNNNHNNNSNTSDVLSNNKSCLVC